METSSSSAVPLLPTPTVNDSRKLNGDTFKSLTRTVTTATLSQAVFHASRSARRASGRARMMHATSGQKCLESYVSFARPSSWGRTYLASLLGTKALSSSRCALTWKLKATRSGRLWFQLAPSMHRTAGTESGLLPTARVGGNGSASQREVQQGNPKPRLETQIEMLPTSSARDWKGASRTKPRDTVDSAVENFQTKHRDFRTGAETGERLQLQPAFVAWMMGYPKNWLSFPTARASATPSGDSRHSRRTGTPSCRRLPSKS